METERVFPLNTILSLTQSFYRNAPEEPTTHELISFICPTISELSQATNETKAELLRQLPWLEKIDISYVSRDDIGDWLDDMNSKYGSSHAVKPIAQPDQPEAPKPPTIQRIKTESYVEFFYFDDHRKIEEVDSREVGKFTVPQHVYGFKFYDLVTIEFGGNQLVIDRHNVSSMYYCGGEILKLRDLKPSGLDSMSILMFLQRSNIEKVIRFRSSFYKPFLPGDIKLEF